MSFSPPPSLRKRGGKKDPSAAFSSDSSSGVSSKQAQSEWDYQLAMAVLTALAFLTRFWNISHPDEVVFDEVHFGKVRPRALCVAVVS